jgi:hypothetical protein
VLLGSVLEREERHVVAISSVYLRVTDTQTLFGRAAFSKWTAVEDLSVDRSVRKCGLGA